MLHLYFIHLLVEKTETSSKRTETTPEMETEQTTNEPYNNGESSESDKSSENWKIGLSVGVVLFVLFMVIGKYACTALTQQNDQKFMHEFFNQIITNSLKVVLAI